MEQFKIGTKCEQPFTLDIKFKDILNVRKLAVYASTGKPVDILEAMETGRLDLIYGDIETLVNVLFVLCLNEIQQRFNAADFDRDNELTYQMFPEQKDEPVLTKASRWFGGLFSGDGILAGREAFRREIINFIPDGSRRAALKMILDKEDETAQLEAEYRLKTAEKMFQLTKEQMESRWNEIEAKELQKLTQELDGLSGSSGNMPE